MSRYRPSRIDPFAALAAAQARDARRRREANRPSGSQPYQTTAKVQKFSGDITDAMTAAQSAQAAASAAQESATSASASASQALVEAQAAKAMALVPVVQTATGSVNSMSAWSEVASVTLGPVSGTSRCVVTACASITGSSPFSARILIAGEIVATVDGSASGSITTYPGDSSPSTYSAALSACADVADGSAEVVVEAIGSVSASLSALGLLTSQAQAVSTESEEL